jgi:DNA adenine methylase
VNVPHPIPYQGSKRHLAAAILDSFPDDVATLIEPFAGSAAVTLAAAARNLANRHLLNDLNRPLVDLWRAIIDSPFWLADQYRKLWAVEPGHLGRHYHQVRDRFNLTGRPDHLLYLLARCVKAAVRYNVRGRFNQSPDHRRRGTLPCRMREQILAASRLLRGRTVCLALDYKTVLARAGRDDLIYLDPPYQGVSSGGDPRYLQSVPFQELVAVLESLNARSLSYLVSYDGTTGGRAHGQFLPENLRLRRVGLECGRSSQATLLGRVEQTVESLYVSPALVDRLRLRRSARRRAAAWFLKNSCRTLARQRLADGRGDAPVAHPEPAILHS